MRSRISSYPIIPNGNISFSIWSEQYVLWLNYSSRDLVQPRSDLVYVIDDRDLRVGAIFKEQFLGDDCMDHKSRFSGDFIVPYHWVFFELGLFERGHLVRRDFAPLSLRDGHAERVLLAF